MTYYGRLEDRVDWMRSSDKIRIHYVAINIL